MLLKAFLFSLITLGICMAVSLVVAAIIKAIGAAVNKRKDKAVENKAD